MKFCIKRPGFVSWCVFEYVLLGVVVFFVVKVALQDLTVSGGGLSTTYQSLQFHLHWGNGDAVPGSEHTVNGMRYPMEVP